MSIQLSEQVNGMFSTRFNGISRYQQKNNITDMFTPFDKPQRIQ